MWGWWMSIIIVSLGREGVCLKGLMGVSRVRERVGERERVGGWVGDESCRRSENGACQRWGFASRGPVGKYAYRRNF